ncbi:hypothetical protein KSP39_PZI006921 [Platanthera zijinensis]|uniref:Uncharacterized protein n=1 Tax=Platanthera zijinensis TaxID=2320716 RepID=A0AAP0G9Q3_9ASPA
MPRAIVLGLWRRASPIPGPATVHRAPKPRATVHGLRRRASPPTVFARAGRLRPTPRAPRARCTVMRLEAITTVEVGTPQKHFCGQNEFKHIGKYKVHLTVIVYSLLCEDYILTAEELRENSKIEKKLLKKREKEIKKGKTKKKSRTEAEEYLFGDSVRGLESRLKNFIQTEVRLEVRSIIDCCELWFSKMEAKLSIIPQPLHATAPRTSTLHSTPPQSSPVHRQAESPDKKLIHTVKVETEVDTDDFKINSLVKNIKNRESRKQKVLITPEEIPKTKVRVKEENVYPGRSYISASECKVLDDMIINFPERY